MLVFSMEFAFIFGTKLFLLFWCLNGIGTQRAPCFECELFKDKHPEAKPYEEIRSHCTYPCECPTIPRCPEGVHLITDGCGCCAICARQRLESCDGTHLCDEDKGLVCEYSSTTSTTGTCQVIRGSSCKVGNATYLDGESFKLDCRTQCTCQNGTYGCVSLCAQEHIRPSARCTNANLVEMPGRCCREWMCGSHISKDQVYDNTLPCEPVATDWSPCSTSCGPGVSLRLSNENEACQLINETRLCQLRPCDEWRQDAPLMHLTGPHHIRRNHFCRATMRPPGSQQLRFDNCTSFKWYRPKHCGQCGQRPCCVPQYTTTVHVDFQCSGHRSTDDGVATYPVMSILKCVCPRECVEAAHEELRWLDQQVPTADHNDHDDQWSAGRERDRGHRRRRYRRWRQSAPGRTVVGGRRTPAP